MQKKRRIEYEETMRPKKPKSAIFSIEDEAVAVGFRRHTLLPLDDCLSALRPTG